MPDPGSHAFDLKRTRQRAYYERHGVPDQHAGHAADADLEREHPPRTVDDQTGRAAGPAGGGDSRDNPSADTPTSAPSGGIELRSPAFNDHALIPDRYAKAGQNRPPALEWTHIPADAQEFALVCEDPDGPGDTFVHWFVTGIPATATGIGDAGALPDGAVAARNDFGGVGWDGPHPPVGDDPHRYFFRLHVSDRPLGLGELGQNASLADLETALDGHELACGTLVGRFAR